MQSNYIKTHDNSITSEYEAGLIILVKLMSHVDYIWESQPERKQGEWLFKAQTGLSDFEEHLEYIHECDLQSYEWHKEKLEHLNEFLRALATAQRITQEQFDKWKLHFEEVDSLQYSLSQMVEFYQYTHTDYDIEISPEKRSKCKLTATWLEKFRRAIAPPYASCGWIGFDFDEFYIG